MQLSPGELRIRGQRSGWAEQKGGETQARVAWPPGGAPPNWGFPGDSSINSKINSRLTREVLVGKQKVARDLAVAWAGRTKKGREGGAVCRQRLQAQKQVIDVAPSRKIPCLPDQQEMGGRGGRGPRVGLLTETSL